jgi:hypothetical protein
LIWAASAVEKSPSMSESQVLRMLSLPMAAFSSGVSLATEVGRAAAAG